MRRAVRFGLAAVAFLFAYLAYLYLTLPDVRPLGSAPPATTAFIELRAREARARGETPRRRQRWVSYDRISPNLTRAVTIAEDSRFWEHDGIDLEEIRNSIQVNLERGTFARGASTITQQLAKNLYLSPSKNPFRKLRELFITRRLEAELSKRRILEIYLNVIEWGDGIYGAEAAAREYFGTSAAALGPAQAALLAGAIVNPRRLNPGKPTRGLLRRQRLIRARMGPASRPAAASGPAVLPPTSEPLAAPGTLDLAAPAGEALDPEEEGRDLEEPEEGEEGPGEG